MAYRYLLKLPVSRNQVWFPHNIKEASGDQAGCLLFIIRLRIDTVANIIVSGKNAILVIKEGNQRPVTLWIVPELFYPFTEFESNDQR